MTLAMHAQCRPVPTVNPFAKKGSRLISEKEFAAVYAAADFAATHELYLDTTVTITWRDFGAKTPEDIQAAFERFEKCLRDWLRRRLIPMAYVYGHERGKTVGLHTHLNVYVPSHSRDEFKLWIQSYALRCGRGGIAASVPPKETLWLHWYKFAYLCKGYDRLQIVQDARSSPDGKAVWLGDVVPVIWEDPGVVQLKQRVGCSRSLDRSARRRGIPGYVVESTDVRKWISLDGETRHHLPGRQREEFRSRYEDGCRDVRVLYGDELYRRVNGTRTGDVAQRPARAVDGGNALDWISNLKI